jgi:hypothetical protein
MIRRHLAGVVVGISLVAGTSSGQETEQEFQKYLDRGEEGPGAI